MVFARFDRWMERAILRSLHPEEQKLLNLALAIVLASGIAASWRYPSVSGVGLLLPLMSLCFFLGLKGTVFLIPLALYHSFIWPGVLPNVVFVLAGITGIVFSVVTVTKYRQARRQELRLEADLALARQIQEGMRPSGLMRLGNLQVAVHLDPCHSLGGDFVCLSRPGKERLGLLLGDVMGKGTQAALTAALLDGLYSELAQAGCAPGELLSSINQRLVERFGAAERMATLFCLEVDLAKGEWVYSRAGHPAPLLSRSDGSSIALDPPGMMAGVGENEYGEHRLPLLPGDQLLLVSDGLVICDLQDCSGIAKRLNSQLDQPLEDCLQCMVQALHQNIQEAVDDDQTAALLRYELGGKSE